MKLGLISNDVLDKNMKTSTTHKLRSCLFAALSLSLLIDTAHAHAPSFSEGLVQAQDPVTKKWGYLSKNGEWAMLPKFDKANEFRSGRAHVMQGDQTMFIEQSGKVAFISKWKVEPWEGFHGGLLRVVEDGKQGFVDTSGKLSIAPEYEKAAFFSEGFAAVSNGGKWGFIDNSGKVVVPLEWDSVGAFRDGLASVSRERKTGFIDKSGALVIPLKYSQARDFQYGIALFYDDTVKLWGVINSKGEVLTSPKWKYYPRVIGEDRLVFQERMDEITSPWGLADSKGKVIVKPTWARIGTGGFYSGLAVAVLPGENAKKEGKVGYIDRDGKVVIPYKYDYTNWFAEGLAFASKGDKKGYIDTTGKFVFELPNLLIIEGEKLVANAKASGGIVEAQALPGAFSAGAHLWWKEGKPGDHLRVSFEQKDLVPGNYDVLLHPTTANDYAIVKITLDGKEQTVDLFSKDLLPGPAVTFENVTVNPDAPPELLIEIVGKNNDAIPSHMAGIDYLIWKKKPGN